MPLAEAQAICDKLIASGTAVPIRGTGAPASGSTGFPACADTASKGCATTSNSLIVHRTVLDAVIASLLARLEEFHGQNKLRLGIDEADLAGTSLTDGMANPGSSSVGAPPGGRGETPLRRMGKMPMPLFALALSELIRKGRVVRQGTVLSLEGKGAKVSADDLALCSQIEAALAAAKITPPSPYELSQQLSRPLPRLEAMIRLLCDQGKLIRLDQNLVMHAAAVESAKKVALALFAAKGGFETVDFRDALGVSRKFAVPLLDYFDTIRLTVRSGSRRTPGAAAKDLPHAT
jgi:selenocysteine-specific elongation factor